MQTTHPVPFLGLAPGGTSPPFLPQQYGWRCSPHPSPGGGREGRRKVARRAECLRLRERGHLCLSADCDLVTSAQPRVAPWPQGEPWLGCSLPHLLA